MIKTSKSALLRASVAPMILGTALLAGPAFAQETVPPVAEEGETIIVTGSRIARPDLTSNSPIAIVTGEAIRETGKVNVEDVLNQMPQVAPGINSNVNNGGDGTATVDLRGIGPTRTLVLINGRRLVPATNEGRTDLNNIPSNLVERVDVVTGGASAVYGSDALAGVVNFILKDDFEGIQLDTQYNISSRGDSGQYSISGILGANFADDRGNIVLSVNYFDRKGSFQSEREFFKIDRQGNGSATGPAGRFDNNPLNPFPSDSHYAFNEDGTPRTFVNQLPETNGGVGDRYNFAPVNYLQTPQKRFMLNLLGHYDITDNIEAFVEGSYTDSRVTLQLAPTPVTGIQVDPNSSALTQEARDLLATRDDPTAPVTFRRRMTDVGPRIQEYNFDVYQINAGLRGDLREDWKYEVYYSYGRTESTSTLTNDVSKSRLTAGLNGCPTGSPAGCLSLGNAFGGTLTEAEADYIRIGSSVDTFLFERKNVVGSISGDLVELPAGPLGVAFGIEYRKDFSDFQPSESSRQGDLGGFNASQPISGGFDVVEFFSEVSVPLLKDQPFAHYLGLEGGARYSDYSTVGGVWTWKAGGEYAPIDGLRFRGLYQRATRAPSVFELYQAGDQDYPTVDDPCATTLADGSSQTVSSSVATICGLSQQLPGVDLDTVTQNNSQVEAQNVGNENLNAETSKTWTFGAVFTPTFLPGTSFSVDYYNIRVDDYIDRIAGGAASLVDACFSSGVTTEAEYDANPYCSNISRNSSGELFLTVPLANNSVLKTSGIDFSAAYTFGIGAESKLTLSANATMLDKWELNGIRYEKTSTYDHGTLPEWRGNLRASFVTGPVTLVGTWRYIGKVEDPDGTGETVGDQNYFDLSGRVGIGDNLELSAGVTNLFDNDPPLVLNGVTNSNTDNSMYDSVGTRLFVGATMKF